MYINHLELHNFRCFDKLELDFHNQLTVIVGGNGAGKTAILEATAIAAGTFFNGMDAIRSIPIKSTDAKYAYYTSGSEQDLQQTYPVEVSARGTIDNERISWKRSLNGIDGKTTIKDAAAIIEKTKEIQSRLRKGDKSLILPIIAYYGTGRMWDFHREKQEGKIPVNTQTNGYIDCLDGNANAKLMKKWFKKMTITNYQRVEENLGTMPEFEVVCEAMAKCLSLTTDYSDVAFKYSLTADEIVVFYTDVHGNRMRLPLNQLSDGYKCTISMVADIAYRMATLNPQLLSGILTGTPGIVLIDEVDLHLHPEWQQRILADLISIFPKVQFIVSTHAPAVINTVGGEHIVIVNNNTVTSSPTDTFGRDVNTIVQTIMKSSERPKEIKELFENFYSAMDSMDYKVAEHFLVFLERTIGDTDPECASCRMRYDLEVLGFGDEYDSNQETE